MILIGMALIFSGATFDEGEDVSWGAEILMIVVGLILVIIAINM